MTEDKHHQHPGFEGEMQPEPDYGYDTYRGYGRLEGKKAIITGGDSGIGRAVALAFAREGADVLISYLSEEEPDALETARVVELAPAFVFLASQESSFVNGETLGVTGGQPLP
jgi:NAD(P)-dependent dehydrogenase (short-subunit alcohol dehydrogenase family)